MSLVLWFSESYPRTTFSGSTPVSSAAARVKRPPNTSLTSRPSGRIKTAAVMCSVLTPCLTNRRHWILMWNMGYRISHIRRGRGWRCSALATVISWVSLNTFFFFLHPAAAVQMFDHCKQLNGDGRPLTWVMSLPKWTLWGHGYEAAPHTDRVTVEFNYRGNTNWKLSQKKKKRKHSIVFKRIWREAKNMVVTDCSHCATLTSATHSGSVTSTVRLETCHKLHENMAVGRTITIITQQKLQFKKHVGNKTASSQNTHVFISETPWSSNYFRCQFSMTHLYLCTRYIIAKIKN